MKTPIFDFLKSYSQSDKIRLHMPGHKGRGELFCESYDITEVTGADSLYEADSVIKESEALAGELFGARTFYSTEGSSLAIRAMLYLAYTEKKGKIVAPRNVHRSFVSAAALIGFDVVWVDSENGYSYLSCKLSLSDIERTLLENPDSSAVYLTSPDYLGGTADISAIAEICHRHGVLLLVDNAHGAYLNFLSPSRHPIALGADLCADSAHKTLSTLTGGAYLHISKNVNKDLQNRAKGAMALFASTSPSYLILSSLDCTNAYVSGDYKDRLSGFIARIREIKAELSRSGYTLFDTEGDPLKITLLTKSYGYLGREIARQLSSVGIECEFSDADCIVFMLTPENTEEELSLLLDALLRIPKKTPVLAQPPKLCKPRGLLSIREAVMLPSEEVSVDEALGRIISDTHLSCPPAVPICLPGEEASLAVLDVLRYYGVKKLRVVKTK